MLKRTDIPDSTVKELSKIQFASEILKTIFDKKGEITNLLNDPLVEYFKINGGVEYNGIFYISRIDFQNMDCIEKKEKFLKNMRFKILEDFDDIYLSSLLMDINI